MVGTIRCQWGFAEVELNSSVLNNRHTESCWFLFFFKKKGYFHLFSSSALCSLLPGACKVLNCKVMPHGSFHVVCNVVISKDSKKQMCDFSSGSTPERANLA